MAPRKTKTKLNTEIVTQFDEFFSVNYGPATSPENTALKIVLSEIIAKWEVFKGFNPINISETADVDIVRFVGLSEKVAWKDGEAKRLNRKHSFSSCWYLEFHKDGRIFYVDWDGKKTERKDGNDLWKIYYPKGFDGGLDTMHGWCMELTPEMIKL